MTLNTILAHLDEALLPVGFTRRKAVWNRQVGEFVDVVDIQRSTATHEITLNIGVLERGVYATLWGHEAEPFVEEPYCIVRSRIGRLMPDPRDRWWDSKEAATAAELRRCLTEYGLPFIERMHSLEQMSERLTPPTPLPRWPDPQTIVYAIIQHRLGNTGKACELLTDLQTSMLGAWKDGAREVAERIGCRRD